MKVLGLMSGTSMDGITAALTNIQSRNEKLHTDLVTYETFPYPPDLKKSLLELVENGNVRQLCRLNFEVGEQFAEVACKIMKNSKEAVELVGSHGQTVCHIPACDGQQTTYTLQIGEADVIAQRTDVTTIADFRTRDIAAGGEGAPLIPYVDHKLFRSKKEHRLALNLGGIANVTYLPSGGSIDEVQAFDTGPSNMVLDQLVRNFTDNEREYDKDGNWAQQGTHSEDLLGWLLTHPFVRQAPPKSTGREHFGKEFTQRVEEKGNELGLSKADILATVTGFTAESIKINCKNFLGTIDLVIASGGGTKNEALMDELRNRLSLPIKTTKEFGIPPEAKEAVGFAILAFENHRGNPNNVPKATGANDFVILGKQSKASSKREDLQI